MSRSMHDDRPLDYRLNIHQERVSRAKALVDERAGMEQYWYTVERIASNGTVASRRAYRDVYLALFSATLWACSDRNESSIWNNGKCIWSSK